MNAEYKFYSLYNNVIDLLNNITVFTKAETLDLERDLLNLSRKLIISKTLFDKNIIAVSGLQGVGKSTLIKTMYNLDDNMLPVVAGRGERIPVLITESSVSSPEPYAIRLSLENGIRREVVETNIEWSLFRSYSMGEDNNVMMLGINVPYKNFNNNYTSFLLLPGFEGNNSEWENLIDYSLTCANSAMLVLSDVKLMEGKNASKFGEILTRFESSKPIFAITFADILLEKNEEIKNTFIKKYKIEDGEEERVINVGCFREQALNDVWINKLVGMLEKYGSVSRNYRKHQLSYIEDIVRKDLTMIVDQIEELMEGHSVKSLLQDIRISEVKNVYDSEKDKLVKLYAKNLKKSLNEMEKEISRNVTETVKNTGFLQKLKVMALKKNINDDMKMEDSIESLLKESDGSTSRIFTKNLKVLNSIVDEKMNIQYVSEDGETKKRLQVGARHAELNAGEEKALAKDEKINPYFINTKVMDNLQLLSTDTKTIKEFKNEDIKSSVALIPVMATAAMTITYGVEDIFRNNVPQLNDPTKRFNDWELVKTMPKNVATTIAGITGVADIADGTPDIVLGIAKTIGVNLSVKAALSITGGAAAAALLVGMARRYNDNDRAERDEYLRAISIIRDHSEDELLENYEYYLDTIRERLIDRLKKLYGVKVLDGRIDNLYMSIERVRNDVREMGKRINEERLSLV